MAIAPGIYNTGTATVASGGLTVSFQGVANLQAAIRPGDRFGGHVGFGIRIAAVGTDSVTLAHPWPGAAQTAAPYEIVFTPYDLSYREEFYEIIKRYGRGALPAMAELVGEDGAIPVFTGPQTMSLLTQQDITNGARYNVQVANLTERGNYNNEPVGFAVLVGDVGDGRAAIYSRVGPAGNWSAPAYITGPAITLDITEVDEVPYGAPPEATLTPKVGGYDLAFEIPRGMIIEPGTTTTLAPGQPAQVNFVPITGGYRLDIALPKGDTGEITGLTTFWQTRVSTDTSETEAQAGLGATATGRALFTAANTAAAKLELELADVEIEMFGGGASKTPADNAAAITAAVSYMTARGLTKLQVSEDVEVSGLAKEVVADITFVGEGKLSGLYRKYVIPANSPHPSLNFAGDFTANHASKLSSSSARTVVVVGDSTSVHSHDGGSRSDGLFGLLAGAITAAFPNTAMHNRSINGSTFNQLTAPPSNTLPWYSGSTPAKMWIDYVRDLNPDVVIFNFGQNSPANLSAADLKNMLDYLLTWNAPNNPNMVLVTPHSPSLAHAGFTEAQHSDRDLAAGMIRTFAQFYGLGLIDIHRASCIARDGLDPRRAAILRSSTTITPSDEGGNVYRAQASGDFEHYRGRVQFNGATWASGSTDSILLSIGGGGAENGGGGDYVTIRKSATGTITWRYLAGKTGAIVNDVVPLTDTGRTMPTAAVSNLYFEVSDGVFSLYPTLDSYVEPIVQRRLWGYGRRKTTYVLSTGAGARITQAEFWPCEPKLSMPFITDTQMYGTTPYFNGNGINHLSGAGSRDILSAVLDGIRWR